MDQRARIHLIRPKCITILYCNSPLFIDIFHFIVLFLCCFGLFYIVCNFPVLKQQKQDSAVKRGHQVVKSDPNSMKFNMCQYFGESPEEPKGGPEGSHQGPRRPPRARRVASWLPGPTPRAPLWPILPPRGRNPKKRGVSEFRRNLVAETYREENAISGGQIPPGRSPPARGDRIHRHHRHHGHT